MKEAAATWAVVVGIDVYDHLPHLTGAARDACAAVGWLRRLGVPDRQIMLHASPSDSALPEVEALGLDIGGCTEPEVWKSFRALIDNQAGGSRLFVFLCGHGFFEPGGHRVFLTREADQVEMMNLGIEWYARLLRGLPYRRQFLFMDGCLNYPYTQSERSRFRPGEHAAFEPKPPRADVKQWLAYAAAQGQQALEDATRGIFTSQLLKALDLDEPNPYCTDVDDERGTFQLDLSRAIHDVVKPAVSEKAQEHQRVQEPGVTMLSAGTSEQVVTVAEIEPPATARLQTFVQPPDAVPDVKSITMWAYDTAWKRTAPVPPAASVEPPLEHVLPGGTTISVSCRLRTGTRWSQPGAQEVVVDGDRDVVFDLTPPRGPETGVVTVNTVDARGDVQPGMTGGAYDAVETYLADPMGENLLTLERHETGPVLVPREGSKRTVRILAAGVARIVNDRTPSHLSVRVDHVDDGSLDATVELRMTEEKASRLAGFLQWEGVVTVGERRYAPAELVGQGGIKVPSGPTKIGVELPWGTWSKLLHLGAGETCDVALPESVGRPPLRVGLLAPSSYPYSGPARTLCSVSTSPLEGSIVDVDGRALGELEPLDEDPPSAWRGRLSIAVADAPLPPWRALAQIRRGRAGRFILPMSDVGPVALRKTRGARAEPLSVLPAPDWDRLVAAGRLDSLSKDDAERLTNTKWENSLLGLGGAYACFAQRQDEYLEIVLHNLRWLEPEIPDIPLLQAALDRRAGRQDHDVAAALEAVHATGGIPVFRWGVSLGVLGAAHYGNGALQERLSAIEKALVPISTWTLWKA